MSANLNALLTQMVSTSNVEEFLKARGLPIPTEPEKAFDLALRGVKTQSDFAAMMINLTKGEINGQALTAALKAAFPSDKVGDRHGPYYLSHARTGKLKVDFIPRKSGGTSTMPTGPREVITLPDPRTPVLEAKLAELEAKLALLNEAKSMKDVKAILNG